MEKYRNFSCPFCGRQPEAPHKMEMHFGETVGGRCNCGAIYIYDETGRMLGQAFVEGLALLYGDDYDAAFSAPEEEYEEEIISYDRRLKRFLTGTPSVFDGTSKFVFLRKTKKAQT
jgi:hypothetical protein